MSLGYGTGKIWSNAGDEVQSGDLVKTGYVDENGILSFTPGLSGTEQVNKYINIDSVYYKHIIGLLSLGEYFLISGAYTTASGQSRPRLSAFDTDPNSTILKDFCDSFSIDNQVRGIAQNGGDIYIGGFFSTVGGQSRTRLACLTLSDIDDATPTVANWAPTSDGRVDKIVYNSNNDVIITGIFNNISGNTRQSIAAIEGDKDNSNPTVRSWNLSSNGLVNDFLINGEDLYLVGSFTQILGTTRNYAACVSSDTSTTATLRNWNPNFNSSANQIVLNGSDMYVCGTFTTVDGTTRGYGCCVQSDSSTSLSLRNWDPDADNSILKLLFDSENNNMYLSGSFSNVRSTARSSLACVESTPSVSTPTLKNWYPKIYSSFNDWILHNNNIYGVGFFSALSRNGAICLDPDDTQSNPTVRSWNPNLQSANYGWIILKTQ